MSKSRDYHDYVFQNGKLVGAFEDMYQHSSETPWHQDSVPDTWHGRVGTCIIDAAFEDGKAASVLETGCGYGYILAKIRRPGVSLSGFDISTTAVEKAKTLHPGIKFFVDDLVHLKHRATYDLVICRENLWYVTDHLEKVIDNLASLVSPQKYLYVGLSFPALDREYIGKKEIPGPQALVRLLERRFDTRVLNILSKMDHLEDGPNCYWLGSKKP